MFLLPAPGPAAAPSPNSPAVSISVLKGDIAVRVASTSNPAVAPLCSISDISFSSDIYVSDMHVSVSDIPVSSARIFDSISDTTLSNTERKQEKENKEETSQRTRENKDKLKDIDIQDQTSLSQYENYSENRARRPGENKRQSKRRSVDQGHKPTKSLKSETDPLEASTIGFTQTCSSSSSSFLSY